MRRSKYGNKKTVLDGKEFDSKKEAYHYLLLKERLQRGEISNLQTQVPFVLVPAVTEERVVHLKTKPDRIETHVVQQPIKYIADFVYEENGRQVVVDVKSAATRMSDKYIIKKKMMRAFLGIKIVEV